MGVKIWLAFLVVVEQEAVVSVAAEESAEAVSALAGREPLSVLQELAA
jgi:hypothetical protein